MSATDPEELARELERETERLQAKSERLEHHVSSARADWEQKRSDPSVPGAPSREEGETAEEQPGSPGPEAPPPEEG